MTTPTLTFPEISMVYGVKQNVVFPFYFPTNFPFSNSKIVAETHQERRASAMTVTSSYLGHCGIQSEQSMANFTRSDFLTKYNKIQRGFGHKNKVQIGVLPYAKCHAADTATPFKVLRNNSRADSTRLSIVVYLLIISSLGVCPGSVAIHPQDNIGLHC